MSDPDLVYATLGAVWHADALLMLKRRPDDRWFADSWCFPGGRMDPGETPEIGLLREIEEETGLEVRIGRYLGLFDSPWPSRGRLYKVHCYVVTAPHRAVQLSIEHSAYRWIDTRADIPAPLAGRVTRQILDLSLPDA